MEVGCHDQERNGELLKFIRHLFRQELLAEFLGVHEGCAAEPDAEQVAERARSRHDKAPEDLRTIVNELDDKPANLGAGHASGIGGAEKRADGAAGNGSGPESQLVERFEYSNMRQPARAATAERKSEALAHRAPASRANSHAFSASGRTSGAIALASSLVAVPSRARPTMPCRMAASRKKL